MADVVIEDFGAAAGNRIEAGIAETGNGISQAEAADVAYVRDFRRRQAVQMDLEARLYAAEQIFVPLDLEIGMQAALHQYAGPPKIDRLLNLVEDGFFGQY